MKGITKTLFAGFVAIMLTLSSCSLQDAFKADIIDSGANNASGQGLYISDNYTALTADTGIIEVKSETGISNIAALSFTLKYNKNQINFSDQFTLGNFVDAAGANVKPEISVATPDNTTGEMVVDIASADSFSLAANETVATFNVTLSDSVQDGDQVAISFSEKQVIDSLFNFGSITSSNGQITIQATAADTLKVLQANVTSATTIEVFFNDYLTDVSTVTAAAITDLDNTQPFSGITSEVDFDTIQIDSSNGKKVILTTEGPLTENTNYKLVFGTGPTGNTKQVLDTSHAITYFAYGGSTLGSTNIIDQNNVQFSTLGNGELNPTQYRIYNSQGIPQVIASIDNRTMTTQAALQDGGKYYAVALGSNRISYFFVNLQGAANIFSISPQSISQEGGSVTVTGQNLEQVTSASIAGTALTISSKTDTSFTLNIPAEVEAGLQDIEFETSTGNVVVKEDFISIEDNSPQIVVLSEESYASPKRVPNDGQTKTTLWVLIEDPRGVGDINKVSLDLRSIGGAAVTRMVGVDKDGQQMIVDNKRWFYLETVIPETVTTSEEERVIPVTAEDPHGNKAYGEISLIVTRNVRSSETPEILEAYGVPTKINPGQKAGFYAYVKDLDGINDIDRVVADLGPIGLGPQTLKSADQITQATTTTTSPDNTIGGENTVGNTTTTTIPTTTNNTSNTSEEIPEERMTMWYGIENLTVPDTTARGDYTINVTATDKSGEVGSSTITLTVGAGNAPEIDSDRLQITPRKQIPNDGQTTFSVQAYVEDADGLSDITAVIVELTDIGGTQVEMDLQGELREGQKGGWFVAEDLVVAKETPIGFAELRVYAYDKQGNEDEEEEDIQVTDQDEVGDAPMINSARSYTTPAAVDPDEETRVTLNAFIDEHNFDIAQVYVDLTNIAKYIGDQTASSADSANSCLGATERMACLTPGIREGSAGQWYTLKDVVVMKTTEPSMEPYQIPVTAVDTNGKTGYGYIYLNVGDGTLPTEQIGFPKVQMAISTSPETVEVLFSNPVDPNRVLLNSFRISSTINTKDFLAIKGVVMNADATVATITTMEQEPEKFYTLTADAKKIGLKESQYTDNHADFVGFDKAEIPPQIVKITPKSSTMLEVIFSEGLRPSSVSQAARDFQVFTHEQEPQRLDVKHVEFTEDNLTVRVSTDTQVSGQRYMLRVNNILSAAGVRVGGNDKPRQTAKKEYFGIHKTFVGFKAAPKSTQTIIESVDFDGNGKVDFTDFTIFSSVYGQTLKNPTVEVELPEQEEQPASEARAAETGQLPASTPVTTESETDTEGSFGLESDMFSEEAQQ